MLTVFNKHACYTCKLVLLLKTLECGSKTVFLRKNISPVAAARHPNDGLSVSSSTVCTNRILMDSIDGSQTSYTEKSVHPFLIGCGNPACGRDTFARQNGGAGAAHWGSESDTGDGTLTTRSSTSSSALRITKQLTPPKILTRT